MKKFNLLAVILLVVSFAILGCSKKEVYVLESGKNFEVGADIPEGPIKWKLQKKHLKIITSPQ